MSDFASISTDPDTLPDYIAISGQVNALDNTQYELGVGLSWYAGDSAAVSTPAHGTFTLNAGQTFTVNGLLADTSPNATTGWDGKSLTKRRRHAHPYRKEYTERNHRHSAGNAVVD